MLVRESLPDLNLATMLPAIDEVVINQYEQYPPQFEKIYRMKTSNRSIEQTTEVSGLGTFVETPDATGVRYDQPLPVYNKTYLHLQYSLGFKVSHMTFKTDQFGVVRDLSVELGKSAHETREIIAALNFNNGFNPAYPGPDAVPMFSTLHPMAGGGTQSNMLPFAADPDVDSLRLVLTMMRRTKNHRGQLQRIQPKTLIVPPELEFVASELLGSDQRPDTANNAINAFKKRDTYGAFNNWMVWDYLTDPHAWYVQAAPNDCQLRWYDFEKFNVIHGTDYESRSIKTSGWMVFSCGWNSFFGIAGVPGQ